MYGPGTGYSVRLVSPSLRPQSPPKLTLTLFLVPPQVFAGKDASRALGMSSLKAEDAVSDYSTLTEAELIVLDDWLKYFTKVSFWRNEIR